MLWTVIEILMYMIAAAVLGVILGWVLRGALGSEQAEVSDLRAQLRALKKEQRELKAESMPEKAPQATSTSASVAPKKETPAKSTETQSKVKVEKTSKRQAAADKKSISSAKGGIKAKATSAKKSKLERDAEQATARQSVIDIVSRVGKGESKDDLTKIHGVGPKFSALLNTLDITSYQQIAKFKKADIRTVSAALGSFSDRIERDDWVGSAKKLLKEAQKE